MADSEAVSIREASRILIFIGYVYSQYYRNQLDRLFAKGRLQLLLHQAEVFISKFSRTLNNWGLWGEL